MNNKTFCVTALLFVAALAAGQQASGELMVDVKQALQDSRVPFTSAESGLVSVFVFTLTQMSKTFGVPKKFAPIVVLVLAALGVALYVLSFPDKRYVPFDLGVAWSQIAAGAAGIYGFAVASQQAASGVAAKKKVVNDDEVM